MKKSLSFSKINLPNMKDGDFLSIMTVRGKISADELGVVTPHEHIFIDLSSFFTKKEIRGCSDTATDKVTIDKLGILARDPYALRDNLIIDNEEEQIRELIRFKEAGGCTVVDATTEGINRKPEALLRVSEKVGLNVVAGTGIYVRDSHTEFVKNAAEDVLADMMVNDIEKGILGTDIKAGIIGEIGVSEYFDENEHKVLRAAGKAHLRTGLPVSVHINPWTTHGTEAAEILLGMGVTPDKICICHIDVENRLEYVLGLLQKGVFVEFDNFGKEYYVAESARRLGYGPFVNDTQRVSFVKTLIDKGYLSQILISCDVCLKSLLVSYGGQGYAHVLENIAPRLCEAGVAKEEISQMLIGNPARFLNVE